MINILPVIKQTPLITLFPEKAPLLNLIIFIIAVLPGFLTGPAGSGPGI
ncbi:MAG: hypothetical protein IEMM0006_1487 [bacterium]|nr:MAG: hypothetical protein IEMM0006_1487 [bacterium]